VTALAYLLTPDPPVLHAAMDTLTVPKGDRRRTERAHMSKMLFVGHLQTLLCFSGSGGVFHRWTTELQALRPAAPGVVALDRYAPEALRRLWAGVGPELARRFDVGFNVWHFGYDPASKTMRGYAYRAQDGFESRALPAGLGYTPQDGIIERVQRSMGTIEATVADPAERVASLLVSVIAEAKAHQDALPAEERLHIGGEVHKWVLYPGGAAFSVLYRFPDAPDVVPGGDPLEPQALDAPAERFCYCRNIETAPPSGSPLPPAPSRTSCTGTGGAH
jgi:hypothetical protein